MIHCRRITEEDVHIMRRHSNSVEYKMNPRDDFLAHKKDHSQIFTLPSGAEAVVCKALAAPDPEKVAIGKHILTAGPESGKKKDRRLANHMTRHCFRVESFGETHVAKTQANAVF